MKRKDWADVAAELIDIHLGETDGYGGASTIEEMANIIRATHANYIGDPPMSKEELAAYDRWVVETMQNYWRTGKFEPEKVPVRKPKSR